MDSVMAAASVYSGGERALAPREQAMTLAAARVGLADEAGVIRKALELERLLATRLIAGGGFSDAGRNVLCLDLAAAALGLAVDRTAIVKQSGMKRPAYLASRSTAEGLLQMRETPTVAGVCLKLQCVSGQGLAERILAAFQRTQDIDLSNPQYACMAVFQACRISKQKVSKSKLINLSGLKPMQWARLDGTWTKFVDEKFVGANGRRCDAADSLFAKCNDDEEMADDTTIKGEKPKEKIEEYEIWRKRILEEAYRELRELEKKERETTPRKSPRKKNDTPTSNGGTPRIDRSKGVRLLF